MAPFWPYWDGTVMWELPWQKFWIAFTRSEFLKLQWAKDIRERASRWELVLLLMLSSDSVVIGAAVVVVASRTVGRRTEIVNFMVATCVVVNELVDDGEGMWCYF